MLPSRAGVRSVLAHWMGDIYETLDVRFSDTIGVNSMLLVKKGYTIALASQGHVENLDPARFAYRPLRPAVTGGVVLAWKRDVPHNAATQAFISYLKGKKERPDAN